MKISDLKIVIRKVDALARLERRFDNELSKNDPDAYFLENAEEEMTELTSQLILLGVDMELSEEVYLLKYTPAIANSPPTTNTKRVLKPLIEEIQS